LYLVVIGRNFGDEEIADDTAHGHDEGCAYVDEQLGRSVADEELGGAAHHQVEGLGCGGAEVFAGDCDHDICVFGDEPYDSFETGHETG
jgi:hypothetical protein